MSRYPRPTMLLMAMLIAIPFADDANADEAPRITKIRPLLADAEKAARQWKQDAALVGVNVKAEADGTVDLNHLGTPPLFEGGLVTVTYRSTSAAQEFTLMLNAKGKWDSSGPLPLSPTNERPPLPKDFLDVDEALAEAQRQKVPLPENNGRNFVDFALSAQKDPSGGANRATWTVTAVEVPPTRIPNVLGQVLLAADSGRATTPEETSGADLMARKIEQLKEGRPLPGNATTIAAWGREADALAADYRPELRPYELSLVLGYTGKQLVPRAAVFRYFGLSSRPSVDGEWSTTELRVDGQRVWIESFETLQRVDRFFPREIPNSVLSPEAALSKLLKKTPNSPADNVPLLLCHSGLLPPDYKRPPEPGGPGMADDPVRMPPQRWVWRTVAAVKQEIAAEPFRGEREALDYVYLAATPDADADSDKEATALLDPLLVGVWEAEVPGGQWTWKINPDSSYQFTATGSSAAPAHSGMVFGRNGRWTLQSTTRAWSDGGTYRWKDDNSVEMDGRLGHGAWQRKHGAKAVARKDEAKRGERGPTVWSLWEEHQPGGDARGESQVVAPPRKTAERTAGALRIRETSLGVAPRDHVVSVAPYARHVVWRAGGQWDEGHDQYSSDGGTAHMVVDGVPGPDFHQMMEPQFSEDGRHLAYVARRDRKWFVIVDGEPHDLDVTRTTEATLFDARVEFSPDGKRWAYRKHAIVGIAIIEVQPDGVEKQVSWPNTEHQLILDGKPVGEPIIKKLLDENDLDFDTGIRDVAFSPDSRRVAYSAYRSGERKVIQRTGPGGKKEVEISYGPGESYVVVDGVRGPTFEDIIEGSLRFSPNGQDVLYVIKEIGKWRLVSNHKPEPPADGEFDIEAISPDGKRLALLFRGKDDKTIKIFGPDGVKQVGPFDVIIEFAFGPDGTRTVCRAGEDSQELLVLDGEPGPPAASVSTPQFSPDGGRMAYTLRAVKDGPETLVIDGRKGPSFDDVSGPVFSPDGKRLACIVRRGAGAELKRFLLIDGVEHAISHPADFELGSLTFSPDGKHLAYLLQPVTREKGKLIIGDQQITVDGLLIEGFDEVQGVSGTSRVFAFEGPATLKFAARRGDEILRVDVDCSASAGFESR